MTRGCYDFVVFDCDGVIFDSNALKTEAFRQTLEAYPAEQVQAFIAYHQREGGVSRYVKLQRFADEIAGLEPPTDAVVQGLLERFGNVCRDLYEVAPLTPGAETLLRGLASLTPLYVASGSDEAELRDVFRKRGLESLFSAIYGSPRRKTDCVAEVRRGHPGERGLMVGDARSDWQAAIDNDLDFAFMTDFTDNPALSDEIVGAARATTIPSLLALSEILERGVGA